MTAEQFKSWRLSLGLSQAAAARELGISTRMLQYYESGEKPTPRAIELACAAIAQGLDGKLSMRRRSSAAE